MPSPMRSNPCLHTRQNKISKTSHVREPFRFTGCLGDCGQRIRGMPRRRSFHRNSWHCGEGCQALQQLWNQGWVPPVVGLRKEPKNWSGAITALYQANACSLREARQCQANVARSHPRPQTTEWWDVPGTISEAWKLGFGHVVPCSFCEGVPKHWIPALLHTGLHILVQRTVLPVSCANKSATPTLSIVRIKVVEVSCRWRRRILPIGPVRQWHMSRGFAGEES